MQVLGEQILTHETLFDGTLTRKAFTVDGLRGVPDAVFGNTLFVAVDPCSGACASMIGVAIVYYPQNARHCVVSLVHACVEDIHVAEDIAGGVAYMVEEGVAVAEHESGVGVGWGDVDVPDVEEGEEEPETSGVRVSGDDFVADAGVDVGGEG